MRITNRAAGCVLAAASVLGLSATVPSTAAASPSPGENVVGGTPTTTDTYPFVMALTTRNGHLNCGGTLVAPRKVVTAAHCVSGRDTRSVRVLGGRTDLHTSAGTERRVTNIWVHPDWGSGPRMSSDVAVLTLADDMPYQPLPYVGSSDTGVYRPGTKARVLGWGRTGEKEPVANVLMTAEVPVVSDSDCAKAYDESFLASDMVCAGYDEGGTDTCSGDSGGPLILDGRLAGMTSWGVGCARPGKFGVYTRLTAFSDPVREQVEEVVHQGAPRHP
ncbi:S1 family peptidase [Streptomyces sp. NPDC001340]